MRPICFSATRPPTASKGSAGPEFSRGFLDSGEMARLPSNVRVVPIHALNCHGFAWLRRVTEENVDLNRNFVDHTKNHPKNTEYAKLHPLILPDNWDDKTVAKSTQKLEAYASKTSLYKLQSVLTGGQYDHPDGIFYGGREPTRAHERFLDIVENHVVGAEHVLFLDWHTGLGTYGTGELLGMTRPGSAHGDRVSKWFSHGLETPAEGPGDIGAAHRYYRIGFTQASRQCDYRGDKPNCRIRHLPGSGGPDAPHRRQLAPRQGRS